MVSYFIYYRVAPGQEALARERVRCLHARLGAGGVGGRLLTKRGEPGLWMEIYDSVREPTVFEQALDHAVAELGFERVLAPGSRRHVECFED